MPPARLGAMQRINAHQLGQLQEVGHAAGPLEGLIELDAAARNIYVRPKLAAQLRNSLQRLLQPGFVARHPAVVPYDSPQLAVERGNRSLATNRKKELRALRDGSLRVAKGNVRAVHLL